MPTETSGALAGLTKPGREDQDSSFTGEGGSTTAGNSYDDVMYLTAVAESMSVEPPQTTRKEERKSCSRGT
ncbi:hypothetical protein ElyMa_002846900 [Elysia marginata]|uniref:Uncharacterized protein n=1 Tax=Elysia marginata TaxID=1093978 RepID=A0AAV4HVP6_9GAST|nr:hypothetical protein ElyMa_002846900 [Elysia marginata]